MIKKLWEKIKQGWEWMKLRIKKLLISLGIVGVAMAAGITAIPQEVVYKDIPLTIQQRQELTKNINYQTSHTPLVADIVMSESWALGDKIVSIKPTKWVATSGGVSYYKDGEVFKPIDLTLLDQGDYWQATKSNYQPKIPKYADDWFEFRNVFKGNDHTVRMKPVAGHVLGQLTGEGTMAGRVVLYPDAFGPGIDLEVSAQNMNLLEKIIIRNPQIAEMSFDFEFESPQGEKLKTHNIKTDYRREASFTKSLSVLDKDIEIGPDDNPTIIYAMKAWDSGVGLDELGNPLYKQENIVAILYKEGGKTFLRKTISADFLASAVYPVFTDADTGAKAPASSGASFTSFTNPTNAYADDGSYATRVTAYITYNYEDYYNFSFGITAGATINGIEALVEGHYTVQVSGNGQASINVLVGTTDKGSLGTSPQALNLDTDTVLTFGGATTLPATPPTVAELNDNASTGFGIKIGIRRSTGLEGGTTGFVDYLTVKVYYTEAPVGRIIMLID